MMYCVRPFVSVPFPALLTLTFIHRKNLCPHLFPPTPFVKLMYVILYAPYAVLFFPVCHGLSFGLVPHLFTSPLFGARKRADDLFTDSFLVSLYHATIISHVVMQNHAIFLTFNLFYLIQSLSTYIPATNSLNSCSSFLSIRISK